VTVLTRKARLSTARQVAAVTTIATARATSSSAAVRAAPGSRVTGAALTLGHRDGAGRCDGWRQQMYNAASSAAASRNVKAGGSVCTDAAIRGDHAGVQDRGG